MRKEGSPDVSEESCWIRRCWAGRKGPEKERLESQVIPDLVVLHVHLAFTLREFLASALPRCGW